MTVALLLSLLLAGPSIASNSACPSSRDIEDQLSVLLPTDGTRPGTAVVVGLPDRLLIDLRPMEKSQGEQRSVEVGNDCEQRAKAAAVVIATWWPNEEGVPSRPDLRDRPIPVAARKAVDVSVGALASASVDGIAPGVRTEFWLRGQKLGARSALGATFAHGASLGRGQAAWWRVSAELGPTYHTKYLRLDAGAVVALLAVSGSEFTRNDRSFGATLGATLGVRLAKSTRGARPWIELRGIGWPLSQRIYVLDGVTGAQTSHALPHVEVQLCAGFAFSLL